MTSDRLKLYPYQQAAIDLIRAMPERVIFPYPTRFGMSMSYTAAHALKHARSIYSSQAPVARTLPALSLMCYNVRQALRSWHWQ